MSNGSLFQVSARLLCSKLLPPINMSVAELARQENISEVTLYNGANTPKTEGLLCLGTTN